METHIFHMEKSYMDFLAILLGLGGLDFLVIIRVHQISSYRT